MLRPRLIFYDPPGKNGGIAAKAFDHCNQSFVPFVSWVYIFPVSDTLRRAMDKIQSCPCEQGCTECEFPGFPLSVELTFMVPSQVLRARLAKKRILCHLKLEL
jgi:hypothetical protein